MKKTKLWSGITAVTATVLCVACAGSAIAHANADTVNDLLNVTLSKIEKGEVDPSVNTNYYPTSFGDGKYTKANLDLMRAAAKEQNVNEMREGAALLYNNAALPIKTDKKVSLFGRASVQTVYQGRAAGQKVTMATTEKTDLKQALEKENFEVNQTLWDSLVAQADEKDTGCTGGKKAGTGTGELDKAFYQTAIDNVGEFNGAAIVTLARVGAEGTDMNMAELDDDGTTMISSLALHKNEREMLELVRAKFGKVIVLLNCGNVMEVEELKNYCDAILYMGTPGAYGFEGVAEILSGTTNPSGHTVDTYAVNSLSAPACVNSGTETPKFANADAIVSTINKDGADERGEYMSFQAESIYIGYRYYETRYYDSIANPTTGASDAAGASSGTIWKYENEISYPFGYGLSYTTFSQQITDIKYNADDVVITVQVNNEGTVKGKSVVQVYAQTPYGDYEKENKVEKSAIELVGFAKTGELAPKGQSGDSETVTVTVDKYLLASYDYTGAEGYILSGGDYYFAIGNDAHDALNNILAAQGKTGMVTESGTAVTADGSAQKVRKTNWNFDSNKYKMSTANTRVTNQFEHCDLNTWVANSGTYLSRSNWKDTYPKTKTIVAATADMMKILSGNTYETPEGAPSYESVASQFGKNENLTLVMMKDVPYEDKATWRKFVLQASIDEIITATGEAFTCNAVGKISPSFTVGDGCDGIEVGFSGGVINIYETSGTTIPHTDANGNIDDKVSFTCNTLHYCGNPILTGTFNEDLYAGRGKMTGEEGQWARAMELYDTGLDLHRTPFGGRSFEYKSECPTMSYLASIPQVEALEKTGTHAAPKHFVGNDQEFYRDGVAVFFNEQAFRQGSLRAFEGALKVAKAGGLMQSFERIGMEFCSASYALNTFVLRTEWGWTGNVVSDATPFRGTSMTGYRCHALETLHAGTQQYCFDAAGNHAKYALQWAKENDDGHIVECVIQSAIDWEYAIVNSNIINGMSSSDRIVPVTPWWQTAFTAVIATLGVLTAAGAAMMVFTTLKGKKEEN